MFRSHSAISSEANFARDMLKELKNAKNKEDFDQKDLRNKLGQVNVILQDVATGTIFGPQAKPILQAFLHGDTIRTMEKIINLRKSGKFNLLNSESHISWVYIGLISAISNAMVGPLGTGIQVGEQYLMDGGVKQTLEELRSKEFLENLNRSKEESLIAKAIGAHLSLLNNTAAEDALRTNLGEIIREYDFYEILKPYAISKYVNTEHVNERKSRSL